MLRVRAWRLLVPAVAVAAAGCASHPFEHTQPATATRTASAQPELNVQDYAAGLAGVHAANPDLKLSVGHDSAVANDTVLFVDYPLPTDDPAGRDVNCDAQVRDWTSGSALAFRVKPDHAVKLSVSFLDRNRVAYTTWVELQANTWQPIRIPFATLRPNPYFQPPDAKIGAPIDVSEVTGIAFAPHDQTPGHLVTGRFLVVQ